MYRNTSLFLLISLSGFAFGAASEPEVSFESVTDESRHSMVMTRLRHPEFRQKKWFYMEVKKSLPEKIKAALRNEAMDYLLALHLAKRDAKTGEEISVDRALELSLAKFNEGIEAIILDHHLVSSYVFICRSGENRDTILRIVKEKESSMPSRIEKIEPDNNETKIKLPGYSIITLKNN